MRKKIFIILLCLTLSLIIIFGFLVYKISPLLGSGSIFMPSYNAVNQLYNDNCETLQDVGDYMEGIDSEFMRWDSFDKNIILKDNSEQINILENENMKVNIEVLLNINMEHILKENNYVMFVLWSSLDSSCGILYSKHDNISIEETELKKINGKGWYYFRHIT